MYSLYYVFHPQLTAVGKIVARRQSPTGETIDGRQNDPVSCDSSTFLNITIYPADQYHPLVGGDSMDASIKGASDIKSKLGMIESTSDG